jgi:two-component system response regulator
MKEQPSTSRYPAEVEILLVEDNADDAMLALMALQRHNLTNRLLHVKDGQEALDYLLAENSPIPRLIMLDLKLPKVDGVQVLTRIKTDERLRTTPVVVLTSSKEEQDVLACYRLGVNSYIVKPVDFPKFVDAVAEVGLYWLLLNHKPA